MTFSIVAVDLEAKEIGFAIASCTWDAGMVGTAKAELGAICSQAQGYFPFHSIFYEKLKENLTLEEILDEFKKVDDFASREFIDRCEAFRDKPPEKEWDGVWVMKVK